MKDKHVYILGLSFFYHDAAAVLLMDGVPVAMAEEERFSRKKHDFGYPARAISFVLSEAGIGAEALDYVVFYEKPFVKFERVLKTLVATCPQTPRVFTDAMKNWFGDKLWIGNIIASDLRVDASRVLFSEHHLSHAASAFLCSPFDEAAILTVDGVGEWATTAIAVGKGNKVTVLKEMRFPHSLGLFYSAFTAFLGFEVNEGEYKVMGMAPYGTPRYADKVRELVVFHEDGSFGLDLSYFDFHRSLNRSFSRKFVDRFGPPRDPGSNFFTRGSGWPEYFGERPDDWEKRAEEQGRYADIAASVQCVAEEMVVALARAAHRVTGLDRLCYAGGVALNSAANWKMANKSPFREVFIQPAAGDAGGALGAALVAHHALVPGAKRNFVLTHAYYGAEYSENAIKEFLDEEKAAYRYVADEDDLIASVVEFLAAGKVVGWFQGRFEWGPRALGARSILADPRPAKMKDMVNVKIKFREPYRPFAPSVLAEDAEEFFEFPDAARSTPGRFMLYVVKVREVKRSTIAAVTHVDGTTRPQLVFRESSKRYWKLIRKFKESTGIPMLLNTSFNLKGEPIVNTPQEAYRTFMRSGLDVLVMGNYVVTKRVT